MKKSFLLFVILFPLWGQGGFAQTIRRCNNDPTVPLGLNMYRTLQAAHDAAVANDIIYVEPSYQGTTTYGDFTCTKTLRIIGNGYDQAQNPTIVQPWEQKVSLVGYVTIEAGTGTVLQGLYLQLGVLIKASNVTITRCSIHGQLTLQRLSASQNASGAIISHNFFENVYYSFTNIYGYSTYNSATCSYTLFPVQNVIFKNNINLRFSAFGNSASGGSCTPSIPSTSIPSANNITITNNTFNGGNSITNCQNCTVHSNIFREPPVTGILNNCPGTAASYNVCSTNPCVNGTNNVDAVTDNILFVGGNATTYDKNLQLTGSSQAVGAGLGGVDAGAFGTNNPYRLSGLAPVPQITAYSQNASSGIYTTATPMSITISVRGNN